MSASSEQSRVDADDNYGVEPEDSSGYAIVRRGICAHNLSNHPVECARCACAFHYDTRRCAKLIMFRDQFGKTHMVDVVQCVWCNRALCAKNFTSRVLVEDEAGHALWSEVSGTRGMVAGRKGKKLRTRTHPADHYDDRDDKARAPRDDKKRRRRR